MDIRGLTGLPAGSIDTLLFDLDGTLIEMDGKAKILFYLRAFKRFKKHFNPFSFYISFWKSMHHMRSNDTERFNHDVFVENMARFGRTSPAIMDALFSELLEKDFQSLGAFFTPVPGAREAVNLAKDLGYGLALVTNPVAPEKSVLYRMEWAGLNPGDFLFITSSQSMTRCKPSVEFYRRLLARLGLGPRQCLMIGNSPSEDLPAGDAGIPTFLVETSHSRKEIRKSKNDPRLDARGAYPDLMSWLKEEKKRTP